MLLPLTVSDPLPLMLPVKVPLPEEASTTTEALLVTNPLRLVDFTTSVPDWTNVPPVYVFTLLRRSVPPPVSDNDPLPETTPL